MAHEWAMQGGRIRSGGNYFSLWLESNNMTSNPTLTEAGKYRSHSCAVIRSHNWQMKFYLEQLWRGWGVNYRKPDGKLTQITQNQRDISKIQGF